jgi:hypothetical protein
MNQPTKCRACGAPIAAGDYCSAVDAAGCRNRETANRERPPQPPRIASVTPLPFAQPSSADVQLASALKEIDRLTAVVAERDATIIARAAMSEVRKRRLETLEYARDMALQVLADELPSSADAQSALRKVREIFGGAHG